MIYTTARVLCCGVWFLTGLYKLTHFKLTVADMARRGIPFPSVVLVPTLILEMVGTSLVVTNNYVWLVAMLWLAFIIVATPIYHGKVIQKGVIAFPELIQVGNNTSIAGGLLVLIYFDPAKPAWLASLIG